ncbi:MAG: hypothetical protein ACK5P5_12320 [Pseudobdellovibrionaceae bacterium]|jgi:hypothetical protein
MEQLNRKIKYWEYSNERYWRDLKFEIQQRAFYLFEGSLQSIQFWSSFAIFLNLKFLRNLVKVGHWCILLFCACVSSRALRLQRQPGEHVLSEDLYRQLREDSNYSQFLRKF